MQDNEFELEVQEDEKKKSFIILYIFLAIIVAFCLTLLYSRYIATSIINVDETPIYTDKIQDEFDGYKIVQFSDLLYGSTITEKKLNKIVEKINMLNPDIVVFTGDLISDDYKVHDDDVKIITDYLKKIESKYGKYAIRGDNDYKNDTFVDIMDNSNFKYLDNNYELLYTSSNKYIFIGGINSTIKDKDNYDILKEYNEDVFKILLTHEPDSIDDITDNLNVDIVLAGHSMLGQFRIPFIGGISYDKGSKKYTEDYYEIDSTKMYVSAGLGTDKYPFRLFNNPEINLYRIIKTG